MTPSTIGVCPVAVRLMSPRSWPCWPTITVDKIVPFEVEGRGNSLSSIGMMFHALSVPSFPGTPVNWHVQCT